MELVGYIWGEDDTDTGGSLVKTYISVERTDADEVAILAVGENNARATIYVSTAMAIRMATMLGIASHAHEIQAHEAERIADRST